jgi:hypothetical protein
MVQTVVTGERATQAASAGLGLINQDTRVIDMSDTIHLLDPNEAPLTAITMKLNKVSAISPKVEWLEDDYLPTTSTTADTVAAAATNFSVAASTGTYFRVGDVLKVLATGETLYVKAISTDAMQIHSVTDGTDNVATEIPTGATLLIIGNANEENSTARVIKTTQKTSQYNFTQIFRWEFGNSGTLQASELYGGSDLAYQQRKAGKEHRIQIERSFLFGERLEETADIPDATSAAIRFCGGIIQKITTNTTDATGTLTVTELETFLRKGMRYGPSRKMLFASRLVVSLLSELAIGPTATPRLQTFVTDSSFPLALIEWVSPHGKMYICTHNLLTESVAANNHAYDGWALLLDLDSIFYRPLRGRDTKLRTNIQANDQDGRIDGYITECCPMLIQEQNHAILNDCVTAV